MLYGDTGINILSPKYIEVLVSVHYNEIRNNK